MKDKKENFFSKILENIFKDQEQDSKKKRMTVYLFSALGLGIALMLIGSFSTLPEEKAVSVDVKEIDDDAEPTFGNKKSSDNPKTMLDYEQRYENELKEALEAIIGVNNVTAMINLDTTEVSVYEKSITNQKQKTEETDNEGGKRITEDISKNEQLEILRKGDQEEPILVKKLKPTIRGVLIVAEGAENIKVKQKIVEAVTRVLDVPIHKVSVQPKKIEGES
jgi:stage III sporulation protein AG